VVVDLAAQVAELEAENAQLRKLVVRLEARIVELERQLPKNGMGRWMASPSCKPGTGVIPIVQPTRIRRLWPNSFGGQFTASRDDRPQTRQAVVGHPSRSIRGGASGWC